MISYHPLPPDPQKPWLFKHGFRSSSSPFLSHWAYAIKTCVWSPIVWKNGSRSQENFINAKSLVLDFDDGETTLDEAVRLFCDVNHIIGTTKSHQKEKNGKPPVDRFRVLLELERPITDVRTFRYNVSGLIKRYESDPACKGGAQYFYPCTAIISMETDADLWPIERVPENFESPEAAIAKEKLAKIQWQRRQQLASWTDKFLRKGECFSGKGREVSAYMVACEMRLAGISKDEAYSRLLQSPFDRNGFNAERELQHAVNSAYK